MVSYEEFEDRRFSEYGDAPERPEPKFGGAEIVFGTIFYLILDILDWFEAGIPGTDVVSWLSQFYYINKGVPGTRMVVANIIELIPGIDYLPIRTVVFLLVVWTDRHPKVEAAAELAGNFVPGSRGAAELQHGPAAPSAASRSGAAETRLPGKQVGEEAFGMPKETFESIEEESFGNIGEMEAARKRRQMTTQAAGTAESGGEAEEEKAAREEKEFKLEKQMGGGQLEEIRRGLGNSSPRKAGETEDLQKDKNAA